MENRPLCSERENDLPTVRLKEERLHKKIGKLEKETFNLYVQVAALEAEKANLLAWPSSSAASSFPNILCELYEEWIHVEVRLDVLHD